MTKPTDPPPSKDRPFPWQCPNCLKRNVDPTTVPYTARVKHDGVEYSLEIPKLDIPRCRDCGELVFSNAVNEQIWDALRAHLRLLRSAQIRAGRKALVVSQAQLAERLGVAEATISRWETGALVQSRAMDNLLRLYFAIPRVREVLLGCDQDPKLGVEVVTAGAGA
jgi:putative zinc finger/helix-turn-helix YgiT family protein